MTKKRIKLSDTETIKKLFALKNEDQLYGFKVALMCFLSMERFRHYEDIENIGMDIIALMESSDIAIPAEDILKGLFVEAD